MDKGWVSLGSESVSVKNEPVVETGLSISVYQTRGLHADDLLAGFGGADGLRVKPGPEYAEGVGDTGETLNEGSNRPTNPGGGGLLYEVEELTRVDCADLRDVRETLALARARRDGHAHRAEAAATISELWITTTRTETRASLKGSDSLDEKKRTVHRRCARVVDVNGGVGLNIGQESPLFNLGQLTRGLVARKGDGDAPAPAPD